MRIVIIANFPGSLNGSFSDRFCYLAKMLHERGHEVELISSDFCHDNKKRRVLPNTLYPFKVTLLHEPGYHRNVSFRRLWAHYVWGRNVGKYLQQIVKPDIIYCAIPSLTASSAASNYCRIHHIRFVIDLQDLWPEAFAMAVKNRYLQKVFLPMKLFADKIYAAADMAVAVSDSYIRRILSVNKKAINVISVFLGNDGCLFDEGRMKYRLERTDDEIVIGYIGNMSTSYDIPCVCDALAKVTKSEEVTKPIRFVLMGGGVDEEKFKNYASRVYPNTTFLGRKTYREMAGKLCCCDMVVNPIVKDSVASIINKVGDYAFSGLPVINSQISEEYRQLIEQYNCGINCECGNSDDMAKAIERLSLDSDLRKKMGDNARKLGLDKFDRRYTYPPIIDALEILCE